MPARADDACLAGASLLPDQRQLAALRTATDAACPCASFTNRRGYQRCARHALHAALDVGTLRAACKRTATATNAGATCGSGKVACGGVDTGAKHPVSCKVRAASDCEDRHNTDATACTDETHCADVVQWTAGTCVDPRQRGPFAAGVRVITYTKPTVQKFCSGGTGTCTAMPFGANCRCAADTDCQSGTCAPHDRVLDTSIWYPAPRGSGTNNPTYAAIVDAPLDPSRGPYPLLMFSHGSCGDPNQSIFFTALLASYGFIVAAPPHPGNTLADFPRCGSPAAQTSSFLERPQDILFVMNALLAADADPSSPFFGAVDETRIGMSGHSFGGLTVYTTVPLDPRFKVALPMAPAVPGTPVLDVPSMTMLGQIDSVVDLPSIRTAYADALPPKYLVEIANAGHFAFSNLCFPGPDCAPPATLTQREAHDAVLRYAVPFLEVYLAGDSSFLPFLSPPPIPGALLASDLSH